MRSRDAETKRELKVFTHINRAKIISGPDTTDYIVNPARVLEDLPEVRAKWGDMGVMEDEGDKGCEDRARKRKMAEKRERIERGRRELEERDKGR